MRSAAPALTKTSERLFTGISTTSRSSSPWGAASPTRSSTSCTPKVCVEGGIGRRLVRPAQPEGSIEEEDPVRPQAAPRPSNEPERCLPRRDVDHIQSDYRVKWCVFLHAPYHSARVDGDRRT